MSGGRLRRGLLLAAPLALLALMVGAGQARAYIYWANAGNHSIGRANLDGSGVDQSFTTGATGTPVGVTVDGGHIYWTANDTIGRANLDASGVKNDFITAGSQLWGVAVDRAHIYWANFLPGTIGRANLDGTGVDQSFINTGPSGIRFLAVDALTPPATHQPIYFFGSVAATIKMPGMPVEGEVIRPSRIYLSADGSWTLVKLHWTGWGSAVARARGISSASTGNPSQAQGKRIKTPAKITLSSPGPFFGREVYRCYQLTVPPPASPLHGCLTGQHGYWNWHDRSEATTCPCSN